MMEFHLQHADSLRAVTTAPATPYKMWRKQNGLLKPLLSDPDIQEVYNAPRQDSTAGQTEFHRVRYSKPATERPSNARTRT